MNANNNAQLGDTGWIRIHRSLKNNPRYSDSEWVHVWISLLLSAAWTPTKAFFAGKEITLQPGQLITSTREISKETGVSPSKVHRVLQIMASETQIESATSHASSLITVTNWDDFQQVKHQVKQQKNTVKQQVKQQVPESETPSETENGTPGAFVSLSESEHNNGSAVKVNHQMKQQVKQQVPESETPSETASSLTRLVGKKGEIREKEKKEKKEKEFSTAQSAGRSSDFLFEKAKPKAKKSSSSSSPEKAKPQNRCAAGAPCNESPPDGVMTAPPSGKEASAGKSESSFEGQKITSEHSQIISAWCEDYEQVFECAYAFEGGKDAKSVQRLVKLSVPIDKLRALWKHAWGMHLAGQGFHSKMSVALTKFVSSFNEIRAECIADYKSKKPEKGERPMPAWQRKKVLEERMEQLREEVREPGCPEETKKEFVKVRDALKQLEKQAVKAALEQ